MPSTSIYEKWREQDDKILRERIRSVRPAVNNQKPDYYDFMQQNSVRSLAARDERRRIEAANETLYARIQHQHSAPARVSVPPTTGAVLRTALAPAPAKQPANTTQREIEARNAVIAQRIATLRPSVEHAELVRSYNEHRSDVRRLSKFTPTPAGQSEGAALHAMLTTGAWKQAVAACSKSSVAAFVREFDKTPALLAAECGCSREYCDLIELLPLSLPQLIARTRGNDLTTTAILALSSRLDRAADAAVSGGVLAAFAAPARPAPASPARPAPAPAPAREQPPWTEVAVRDASPARPASSILARASPYASPAARSGQARAEGRRGARLVQVGAAEEEGDAQVSKKEQAQEHVAEAEPETKTVAEGKPEEAREPPIKRLIDAGDWSTLARLLGRYPTYAPAVSAALDEAVTADEDVLADSDATVVALLAAALADRSVTELAVHAMVVSPASVPAVLAVARQRGVTLPDVANVLKVINIPEDVINSTN